MKWRNPFHELPLNNQKVWIMVEPHKWRGSVSESVESIQIVCGVTRVANDGEVCVTNYDELGLSAVSWYFKTNEFYMSYDHAIAWIPVEEMKLPDWRQNEMA